MRWLLSALALIVLHSQALAWVHGSAALPAPVVTCSFSTGNCVGVGGATAVITPATCNGVADDAPSFSSANSWTRTWLGSHSGLVEWDLSAFSGGTCVINANTVACGSINPSPNLSCPFLLLPGSQLLVYGPAVTINPNNVVSLGGVGTPQGAGFISIRVSSANAGDSCVTTQTNAKGTTPITYTNFAVGRYARISGFDLQGILNGGGFGQPANNAVFEYHKITSITSTTPGQICFDAPLTKAYKSTWPLYDNGGTNGAGDEGGPATVFILDPSWDGEVEYRGITFLDRPGGNTLQAQMRKVTFRSASFSGTFCFSPSEDGELDFINTDETGCSAVGSGLEIDKLTDVLSYSGGTHWGWQFQSSSGANSLALSNLTVTHCLSGTPLATVGTNVTFSGSCGSPAASLFIGAQGYGASKSFSCTNCAIPSVTTSGVFNKGYQDGGINNTSTTCSTASSCWTMAAGTITIPNVGNSGPNPIINQERSFPPGANIMWSGAFFSEGVCQVSDITQDATNTYVALSGSPFCGSGFPTSLPLDTGKLYVRVHPMPDFTCSGCTGTAGAIMANWPAHSPYGSYDQIAFTGATGTTPQFVFGAFGKITSVSANVTAAYTGAGTLTFALAQSGNIEVINSSQTGVSYNPVYDAKTTGNRVTLLNGTTTCNGSAGACSASDSGLAPPDATYSWITAYQSGAAFSSNADSGGQSHITVTIQTNQGVVP